MGINRDQLNGIEASFHTRQDRNATLSAGGLIGWDTSVAGGTITWSSNLVLYLPGVGIATVNDGGGVATVSSDQCVYVDINRLVGGAATPVIANMNDADLLEDNIFVLCVRGSDDRLHWRDGTVIDDGQTVRLGTSSPGVSRNVVVSAGVEDVLVGFDYVVGTGQLLVVVGGIVQELGRHYSETAGSPGEVAFDPLYTPSSGERIVFMNLNGSQGPSGVGNNLQESYTEFGLGVDRRIVVDTGMPLEVVHATGSEVVQTWGTPGTPDNARVSAAGAFLMQALQMGADTYIHYEGATVVVRETATDRAILLDPVNGVRFGTSDGATFTPDDVASDGPLRAAYYTVILDNSGPTEIALADEVADNFKGALCSAYNGAQTKWYSAELAAGQNAGGDFFLLFDPTAKDVIISGDYSGAAAVGSSLQNQEARVVVFY